MSDGAEVTLPGFVDRSRFRPHSLSEPNYVKRQVSPVRRQHIQDFASAQSGFVKAEKTTLPTNKFEEKTHTKNSQPESLISYHINTDSYSSTATVDPHIFRQKTFSVSRNKHSFTRYIYGLIPKNRLQLGLSALALLMVVAGGYISVSSWQANHVAKAQAINLTKQANAADTSGSGSTNSSQAISTVKPSAGAIAAYSVEPNYPKYLKIPEIGVDARILQVGVLANGALGTPDNVYDTAWYTGSAEPGQPGATLIDGHVSSWTAHGVFYNLYKLSAGDTIQVVKGDNSVVNYQVVKTQVYSANSVNMQSAVTPINPNAPGLNLITCTGQVIKGTSLFNERVIVYAQEV